MTNQSFQFPIFSSELSQHYRRIWDHSRLKDQEFKIELARAASFHNCFNPRLNLTEAFKNDIEIRTKGEIPLSIVIQIFGKQGDGKTKLGFEFGKRIDPNFSADKVFMKVEDALNYCRKAKPGDCLQLDEQTIEFGEGSLRQEKELQNIEEVTRIKQVHFIYCSPTLRQHLAAHYTIKVIQKNLEYRITKFAFCSNSGNSYYGWGTAFIPKDEDCSIYQAYLPKKLEYAQKVLERSMQKYDLESMFKELLSHPLRRYAKSASDMRVIASDLWPTLTIGEHKRIVGYLILKLRKQALEAQGLAAEA